MIVKHMEENDILNKYIIYPEENDGFKIPFVMLIPKGENISQTFAVQLETPPVFESQSLDEIYSKLANARTYNFFLKGNKVPTIIPLLPRFDDYYIPFFPKSVYENRTELLPSFLTEEEKKMFENVDEQVANMIRKAKEVFNSLGCEVEDKALVCGYSASSKFASLFAYLHPDVVKAVIAGGTTGLTVKPVKEIGGRKIEFPLGICGLPEHLDEYRNIPQFYYIGSNDENDPALCKCEFSKERDANGNKKPLLDENGKVLNPILTEDGKYQALYKEQYSDDEVDTIYRLFGHTPQERFITTEKIYNSLGINATFRMYDGDHITVIRNEEMRKDLNSFINDIILTKDKEK